MFLLPLHFTVNRLCVLKTVPVIPEKMGDIFDDLEAGEALAKSVESCSESSSDSSDNEDDEDAEHGPGGGRRWRGRGGGR